MTDMDDTTEPDSWLQRALDRRAGEDTGEPDAAFNSAI